MTKTLLAELRQQLETIKEAHMRELATLKQQYNKENTEIKDMAEEQRHKLITEIDSLNTANQHLQKLLQQKEENSTVLKADIENITKQTAQTKKQLDNINSSLKVNVSSFNKEIQKQSTVFTKETKIMSKDLLVMLAINKKDNIKRVNSLKLLLEELKEEFEESLIDT